MMAVTAAVQDTDLVPLGVLTGLLTLVGVFVRTTLKVMMQDRGAGFVLAEARKDELTELRMQNELLRGEISQQRSVKHDWINRATVAEGTLKMVQRIAPECTCGALHVLGPLLEVRDD